MGIVDIITLLFAVSGFGLQPNPRPATPDAALTYAIADADVVVHVDATSLLPGNYKRLTELADQPQMKSSPELQKMVRQAVGEVDGLRAIAKTATGIDVVSDIADVTAFVQMPQPGAKNPNMVVAAHGKFSTATIDKIAAMVHRTPQKPRPGVETVDVDTDATAAVTADGVLLFGTTAMIAERTSGSWKAPAHGAGTSLGYAGDVIGGKPVFAFIVALSSQGRDLAAKSLGASKNLATDLVARHKAAAFAIYHDGIGWLWVDSTKAGLDAMTEMSNGVVEVLRASQVAPRGMAKIALGALESYRGTDKQIDELLAHKADLDKLIAAFTGDGNFKAKVDADAKTLRLNVRLTGKSASDVVPFGVLVPLGAIGFLVESRRSDAMAMPASSPPRVSVPPIAPAKPAPAPQPKRK